MERMSCVFQVFGLVLVHDFLVLGLRLARWVLSLLLDPEGHVLGISLGRVSLLLVNNILQ